jgi:hypothetical protein
MMPRAAVQPISGGSAPGNALEWRVDRDVADGGQQREQAGDRVADPDQIERASADQKEAKQKTVREADAVLRHGARRGARHAAVEPALQRLVERAGAGRDHGNAKQRLHHIPGEG